MTVLVKSYYFKIFIQTFSVKFLYILMMKFLDLHTEDQENLKAGLEDSDSIKSDRFSEIYA